ncbi:MAG: M15 family metallopeptidase [Saprospiraceae bacterium]
MSKGKTSKMEENSENNLVRSSLNVDYIMGRFDPAKHAHFSIIDKKYADREGLYMRKEAYRSFKIMWQAAKTNGINLEIKSATRNFFYQKGIWERKWKGETILSGGINAFEIKNKKERALKILLYSSMPGTSRHHWGTDIDLNSFSNEWFEKGEGLKIYSWLIDNASVYGFCQVYTQKGDHRPHGYEEEKWHWSYTPISKPLTLFAKSALKNDMIRDFAGAETALQIDVVKKYVLGIHSECLE